MATFAKIKENYLGAFCGVLCGFIAWLVNPSYADCIDMIRALPQLTTCVFGFLLTLLGIILQGDGPIITKMRASTAIYNRFINYNKKVVILSFVMTLLALMAGFVHYNWLRGLLLSLSPCLTIIVRKLAIAVLVTGSIWLVVDLTIFVRLFYLLIRQYK